MDRSLDEIIAEDTRKPTRPSGGRRSQGQSQGRRRGERDGVRKVSINQLGSHGIEQQLLSALLFLNRIMLRRDTIVASPLEVRRLANEEAAAKTQKKHRPYQQDRVDLNLDWVHDKFNDNDRDSRPRGPRRRHSPDRSGSALTKVRVENLHYDITESDLEDLFGQIGPVSTLTLAYDRAGRSEGVAYVTYTHLKDAHTSIQEFDGANAKGQPIRLSLIPGRRGDRGGDRSGGSSLFDRVERPARNARSLSPSSDNEGDRSRRRRGGPRARRSDVTGPTPDGIDRYVPGQRSSNQRGEGRRGGRDNKPRNAENGGRRSNARPRKTQEELDQEMEDYWGGNGNDASAETAAAQPEQAVAQSAPAETAPAPAAAAPAHADDDIDMIE
ncbi:Nucleotide-binding alpha-beta plait [Penicillium cosmopolitanum]|uniref:Nucleotide-binding alpha-beta plait n=1 Tax=Penicillium cosmopolitanum TaxID=1131564 RepID=A0A9W9W325_9EURO|nr:Nucleotide-binding alpha-beta plait [Penicillium cosmopolitanum]KAJ5397675.1 Nucleotide-binding alpha-beta plait [Penicillium cosmopolitanum]